VQWEESNLHCAKIFTSDYKHIVIMFVLTGLSSCKKNVQRKLYNWKNVRLLTVSVDQNLYWKFIAIQLFNKSLFVSYSFVPLTYLQQIRNTTVFARSLQHLFARSLRHLFARSLRHHSGVP
jgi:hypothetical protein